MAMAEKRVDRLEQVLLEEFIIWFFSHLARRFILLA